VRRELPWRATRDPYRIWVAEIMLQQTRVAAVLPYYERFLARFPDVASLAGAGEDEVLAAWAGLGYYSRARNLHQAARRIAAAGAFPSDYASLRALPGVGAYTAAAVASIAFGLPYAVVDGNVLRVLARLTGEPEDIGAAATRRRLEAVAQELLDRRRPGEFNQALMELGATVCQPRRPACTACPLERLCQARRRGLETELPRKRRPGAPTRILKTLLLIERGGRILLRKRHAGRLAGFWELPEAGELPGARLVRQCGEFRHAITNHDYRLMVVEADLARAPDGFRWIPRAQLAGLALATTAKKALALCGRAAQARTSEKVSRHSPC
jgi:A/G-specific adenine glycosylase